MYIYITASKDATIKQTYPSSNFGKSSLLSVGLIYNDYTGLLDKERSLLYFNFNNIKNLENSTILNPTYSLHLFSCFSKFGNQPYNFDIELLPVSSSLPIFVEGNGIDENGYITGAVSWVQKNQTINWETTGSEYFTTIPNGIISQSFENGQEDFYKQINNYVDFLSNSSQSGLLLKLTDHYETGSNEINKKIFYSKDSSTIWKPNIEIKWDDSLRDDKGIFKYNKSNNMVYYNYVDNILSDVTNNSTIVLNVIPSGTNVILYGATASKITHISGAYIITGVNFTTSYSGTINYYNLQWKSGSQILFTESMTGSNSSIYSQYGNDQLLINCINLKQYYDQNNFARFDFFIREKYPTYAFMSGNSSLQNIILPNMWYEIVDLTDGNNYIFMPYDEQCTKLSYDKDSNYFNLIMSSFYKNREYGIKLKYKFQNQTIWYPKEFKFVVK